MKMIQEKGKNPILFEVLKNSPWKKTILDISIYCSSEFSSKWQGWCTLVSLEGLKGIGAFHGMFSNAGSWWQPGKCFWLLQNHLDKRIEVCFGMSMKWHSYHINLYDMAKFWFLSSDHYIYCWCLFIIFIIEMGNA